jgi:Ca2+-transporting ATPase
MARVMAIRSNTDSLFTAGVLSNPSLAAAVAATVSLQLAVVYLPLFNVVFDTLPLSGWDVTIAILVASLILVAVELEKALKRRRTSDINETR